MGKFDEMEKRADYTSLERIGDSRQAEKLPMKKTDSFSVKREMDSVTPDILINMCKNEKDGEKHQLLVFYTNSAGKREWIPVAIPKYRMRKYNGMNGEYLEVVDCRNGKRKTFKRRSIKTVKKFLDRGTGKWIVYKGMVDTARFK